MTKKSSSNKILYGLIIGTLIGILFNFWGADPTRDAILKYVTQPMGDAFLQGLKMIIVPLVFASLITGIASLGSVESLGKLGLRLGTFYVVTTFIAIFIGQILISTIQPGVGIDPIVKEKAMSTYGKKVGTLTQKSKHVNESLWPGIVKTIIPKNILAESAKSNMLAIIFSAFLFGIAFLSIDKKKSEVAVTFFDAISDACIKIVGWIMALAPYAVAALMINAVSLFGFEIMKKVIFYVIVVVAGYLIHFFGTYTLIVKYLLKIPLSDFYKGIKPILTTAFSTSSSSATMPTTMRTLKSYFGVPQSIVGFSIPLGATVNMDGTALFEVIAALFIAQVFGVDISLTGQISLVILVLLTSIGVAGVPGGSIPVMMSAMVTLGIPPEGIAIILGVDRLLDMGRTLVNVTGDSVAALYLAKSQGVDLNKNILSYNEGS